MKNKILLTVGLMGCLFSRARAQDFSLYERRQYANERAFLPYRILYPVGYTAGRSYPTVIFLHGAYEKGYDNEMQLENGGALFLRDSIRGKFPAVVIFPQCPGNDLWADFEPEQDSAGKVLRLFFPFHKNPTVITGMLKGLLDSLVRVGIADSMRLYVGGLSQGGMGVFDLVARYPGFFAAAFPICGAGNVSTAKKIYGGKTALWIFHGAKDKMISPEFSRDFYHKLHKLGADVRYTEYPGAGHNCWDSALAEKELLPWIFSKKKG